jgi:hypothetical protein
MESKPYSHQADYSILGVREKVWAAYDSTAILLQIFALPRTQEAAHVARENRQTRVLLVLQRQTVYFGVQTAEN